MTVDHSVIFLSSHSAAFKNTSPAEDQKMFGDLYEVTNEVLGSTSKNKIFTVVCRKTGKEFALKTIPVDLKAQEEMADIELEVFRRGSGNENIVQAVDIVREDRRIHVVMERFGGGNLENYCKKHGAIAEGDAAKIIKSVALALRFFHSSGVAHRDVKPENVFLSGPDLLPVKLGDYDSCSGFGSKPCCPTHGPELFSDRAGTLFYMAPEVRRARGHYGKECDMWSLGVLLYYLFSVGRAGETVEFDCGVEACEDCRHTLMESVRERKFYMTGERWRGISGPARDLILRLVVVDPSLRLRAEEVLSHPWIERWTESDPRVDVTAAPAPNETWVKHRSWWWWMFNRARP